MINVIATNIYHFVKEEHCKLFPCLISNMSSGFQQAPGIPSKFLLRLRSNFYHLLITCQHRYFILISNYFENSPVFFIR